MAYYDNYLIDTSSRVILEAKATPAIFHHETVAARRMVEEVKTLGLQPESLGADKACGSGEFLAWLLAKGVQPFYLCPTCGRSSNATILAEGFTRQELPFAPELIVKPLSVRTTPRS